jgi:glycine oxidase
LIERITVLGAGIFGTWQALILARAGHRVLLLERSSPSLEGSASLYAGAMLAPFCEAEACGPHVAALGAKGLVHWRREAAGVVWNGTLVVAGARDRGELTRFARATDHHELIDEVRLGGLEADLKGRFGSALFYAAEGHVEPRVALTWLREAAMRAGAEIRFDAAGVEPEGTRELIVDCRGLAARSELPSLRGVRGERIVLRSRDIELSRPVRLLHPRHPLYVVPWGEGRYMVGATVIEREDGAPTTARSALELLGMAYALHPAFGEAEILDIGAGVRPAFPDNMPRVIVRGRRIYVNGAYRHGFLLAPVLAEAVATYLETGTVQADILSVD